MYMYYMLCTPYLKKELMEYMETRETCAAIASRGLCLEHLTPTDVNKHRFYSRMKDRHGRTLLSLTVDKALANKMLLFVYTDGKPRKKAFALLQCISQRRTAIGLGPNIARVLGGSLGLGNVDMIGDKTQMADMLTKHKRSYAPETFHWDVSVENWKERLTELLQPKNTSDGKKEENGIVSSDKTQKTEDVSTPLEEEEKNNQQEEKKKEETDATEEVSGEYVICKPSRGQQQRGILICKRELASLDLIIAHCTDTTLEGGPYSDWVMQKYIINPYLISGKELGTLIPLAQEEPWPRLFNSGSSKNNHHHQQQQQHNNNHHHHGGEQKKKKEELKPKIIAFPPIKDYVTTSLVTPIALLPHISTTPPVTDSTTTSIHTSDSPELTVESMLEGFELHAAAPITQKTTTSQEDINNTEEVGIDNENKENIETEKVVDSLIETNGEKQDVQEIKKCIGKDKVKIDTSKQPPLPPKGKGGNKKQQQQHIFPSDSGTPLIGTDKFKAHFRYYAMILHDSKSPRKYQIYSCDLFKVYHSKEAYDPKATSFNQSISKYLALRLGNECVPKDDLEWIEPKMRAIVLDILTLGIKEGGFLPFGFSHVSFQNLGFDFLLDPETKEAILLECNINPGQGIMRKEVMCAQGMSSSDYTRLHTYWANNYRKKFVEGIMNFTVAPVLERTISTDSSWRLLGEVVLDKDPPQCPPIIDVPAKLRAKLGLDGTSEQSSSSSLSKSLPIPNNKTTNNTIIGESTKKSNESSSSKKSDDSSLTKTQTEINKKKISISSGNNSRKNSVDSKKSNSTDSSKKPITDSKKSTDTPKSPITSRRKHEYSQSTNLCPWRVNMKTSVPRVPSPGNPYTSKVRPPSKKKSRRAKSQKSEKTKNLRKKEQRPILLDPIMLQPEPVVTIVATPVVETPVIETIEPETIQLETDKEVVS